MHKNRLVFFPLLSVLLLTLAGCIGGATSPSQFYMLEPISDLEHKESVGAAKNPLLSWRLFAFRIMWTGPRS